MTDESGAEAQASSTRFEALLLSRRFHEALDRYVSGQPARRGAVFRVLRGLLTDYRRLQRSPIHNPKHRLFHTRLSRADRLIDLPLDGELQRHTLLLNLGDHSVNEWAERYGGDVQDELRRVAARLTSGTLPAPTAARDSGPGPEPEPPSPSSSAAETATPGPKPVSPWHRPGSRPGTYGQYLTEEDLRYHGVPDPLIPVVLGASDRLPLTELGLDEAVADALDALYCGRAPSEPLPVPPPRVGPPEPLVVRLDQLPGFLRLPLGKFLAQVSEEQRRLIETDDMGLMVVKGAAGTGKTVVGVRRIEHLLMAAQGPVRILFLCYNQVLRDAVYQMLRDVLGNLPEELGVTVRTAYAWLGELRARYAAGLALQLVNRNDLQEMLRELRTELPAPTPRVGRLSDAYILDEFAEVIYGRAVPDEAAYVDAHRTERAGRGVALTAEERRYLWGLFQRFEQEAASRGQAMWEWLPARLLQELPDAHPDWPLYDAVVVDEAQDLPPVVFRVLLKVQGGSDRGLLVLGDAAQNVYRRRFRWVETGLRVTGGRVAVLRRCFRSTRQIVGAAAPLLSQLRPQLADDLVEPQAADLEGPRPEVFLAESEEHEAAEVARRIFELIEEGVPASSIAVFAQTRRELEGMAGALARRGIPCERYEKADGRKSIDLFEPSVKLITTWSAKGIEFPVVFIVGVTEARFPSHSRGWEHQERARRMLYTAMMRAAYRLTLSAVREQASGLLKLVAGEADAPGGPAEATP